MAGVTADDLGALVDFILYFHEEVLLDVQRHL